MKKISFTFIRFMMIMGIFFALGGFVFLFLSQSTINAAITTQETVIASINNLNGDFTSATLGQIESLKTGNINLQNLLNTLKTYLIFGQVIFVVVGFILFLGLILTFSINNQVETAIKNGYESGKLKGIQDAIVGLDKDPSILLSMLDWVLLYKKGKGNSDTANNIMNQFFRRAQDTLGLQPYGMVGDVLSFDHQRHTNKSAGVKPGDKVKVVEAGWKLGNTIIRKPKVERE